MESKNDNSCHDQAREHMAHEHELRGRKTRFANESPNPGEPLLKAVGSTYVLAQPNRTEMTMRIWKWALEITDRQTIAMPAGAEPLTVQMQGETPQLWALCDERAPKEARRFAVYGTGNPMPDQPGQYVATFQSHGGSLVWHLFDLSANTEVNARGAAASQGGTK